MEKENSRESAAGRHVQDKLERQECVFMDGGIATELGRMDIDGYEVGEGGLWGSMALYKVPGSVLEAHRGYLDAGCDVISTATWGLHMDDPEYQALKVTGSEEMVHWMDAARLGIRLARQAVEESGQGRGDRCAVAYSLNGDFDTEKRLERLRLLSRIFKQKPPNIILMDSMSLIREGLTLTAVESMVKTGIPVWLSFRRCRRGVCGVYGQHWGGPEGDLFGRAAQRFEGMGVRALLLSGIPASHVDGMITWLRDFTDLPLGVFPILGLFRDPGWSFDDSVKPDDYADMALGWRGEGAGIIGGGLGVSPKHISAAREKLGSLKPIAVSSAPVLRFEEIEGPGDGEKDEMWKDEQGRSLFPLSFPQIVCDPKVFQPTQGSFLIWKHLFRSGTGKGKRCLDVGCGTGILTVQLALNDAQQVHAIDIQSKAVENTLANAFRNGVAERVSGETIDLYTAMPAEKYDIVVASLYQTPVDPHKGESCLRPADFWGRNVFDHLINLLPGLLEEGGIAYLMQISVLSQRETVRLMRKAGLKCKVIDFSFFQFGESFMENIEQIRHVEELSDAYHLSLADEQVMVMYLFEVTRR